jgi:hypothetical protein
MTRPSRFGRASDHILGAQLSLTASAGFFCPQISITVRSIRWSQQGAAAS